MLILVLIASVAAQATYTAYLFNNLACMAPAVSTLGPFPASGACRQFPGYADITFVTGGTNLAGNTLLNVTLSRNTTGAACSGTAIGSYVTTSAQCNQANGGTMWSFQIVAAGSIAAVSLLLLLLALLF